MMECLAISSKELDNAFKEREDARVPFDHYRMKVPELQQKIQAGGNDVTKLKETLDRNTLKFQKAKGAFDASQIRLDEVIKQVQE